MKPSTAVRTPSNRLVMSRAMTAAQNWLLDPTARKTAVSLLDQVVLSGAGFATSIILGRWGSPEQLGVYFLALTVILIARGVQAELVTAPYSIYRHELKPDAERLFTGSIILHQLGVLLFAAIGFLVGAMVAIPFRPDLAPTLWVLVAAAPILLAREFIRQFCFARVDVVTATILDIVATAIQISGLLLLWRLETITSTSVYVVLALANAAGVVVGVYRIRGVAVFAWKHVRRHWTKNWGFAKWALSSQLICSCTPYVMPWVLAVYHDEATAGVGAACATLIGLAYVFTTAVSNILTPRAAAAYADGGVPELTALLWRAALTFIFVLSTFSVVVFFAGGTMLHLVYGQAYDGYGMACFVFSLGVLANSMSIVAGNGIWAVRRPQANLPGDVTTLVTTLVSAALLAPPLGVLGAALATLIGTSCGAVVRFSLLWWLVRRDVNYDGLMTESLEGER